MLSVHHICKSFNLHTILNDITFSLNTGERVGLIGPNGCGKTTLLRILVGQEVPDSGTVALTRPGLRIGYLPQGLTLPGQLTLDEAIHKTFSDSEDPEVAFVRLAESLAQKPSDPALQQAYDELLDVITLQTSRLPPASILASLGLDSVDPLTPLANLSGGQKTRLALALVLLEEPHLLLLDEPTNHLDIHMLQWLETWLKDFPGAALIVSHDRAFLDNTVTRIFELDPQRPGLHEYIGNYSAYFEQRQAEIEEQWAAYRDQQAEIRHMKADIARTKAQASQTERAASSIRIGGPDYKIKGYKSYQQGIAKKVARKAKAREKKLERYLESDELVERPRAAWQMKLEFHDPRHRSHAVLVAEGLSVGYPGCEPLLTGLDFHICGGERVALTGPNGCGKTTLLRTLAGKLEPICGSVRTGSSVKLGYMTQEQENLDLSKSPLEIIQSAGMPNETQARHFLHFFLFSGDSPLRPCAEMSYGERSRLELALLVAQGCTFLLLDEPINHLDIPSRAHFEQALSNFEGTVLAVVHDRYFIERFATVQWEVKARKLAYQ